MNIVKSKEQLEREIVNRIYQDYKALRIITYQTLAADNPDVSPLNCIQYAQTILDRILFIAFAEDCGLLPNKTIAQAYQHSDPYNPKPTWENFLGLFRAIDKGNATLNIPAYNGGLFQNDPALETLKVSDTLCEKFKDIGEYDFASEVSVTVLGHIFEQSISDIEELQAQVQNPDTKNIKPTKLSKRKQDGIFYTPAYI
ncbi:hypothetical protein TI05_05835 [Achromatium sp. WMS3]|nr:hypothetical protein TI05_05835 [Achromatium sp. WMS3]